MPHRNSAQIIEYNKEKWNSYVPSPIDFIGNSASVIGKIDSGKATNYFGVKEERVIDNLEYFVQQLEEHERITPPWANGKSYYNGDLKLAYNEWVGMLTLRALMVLDTYDMIEKN